MKIHKLSSKWAITTLITFSVTASQFSLVLYTPSLPAIEDSFGLPHGTMQITIPAFLFTFGLSSLLYGPLSDHYGRRSTLLFSLGFMLVGTLLILLSWNIVIFSIGRLLQGLGAGGPSVITRAVIRDKYEGPSLAKAMSSRILLIAIAPGIAPVLGGYLQTGFGWRSNFLFLFVYICFLWGLFFLLFPETNQWKKTKTLSIKRIAKSYHFLFTNPIYLCFAGSILFCYTSQVLYLTIAPFIFQLHLNVSPSLYGVLIIFPPIGYLIGGLTSRLLHHFMHFTTQMFLGSIVLFFTALIWIILYYSGIFTILSTLLPLSIAMIGIALIFPNSTTGVLKPFAQIAGTAAALSGFIQMSGSGIINAIISEFYFTRPPVVGFGFLINSTIIFILTLFARKLRRKYPELETKIEKNHDQKEFF